MKNIIRKLAPETYLQSYAGLFKLGSPVLLTQLGIIAVSFADTMMVGAYGLNELAAAAFVNSLFIIVIVMLFGFSGGITPLIGALYGRGDHEEAGIMLRASLQVNVIVAMAFTLILCGVYFLLGKLGQDPDLLPLAEEYFLIILCTLVPMAIFNCFQQTANGTTDTATPMWMILGTDVINIFGNYLLIFGKCGFPEMGLAGAGISTLVSRICGCVGIVAVFAFRKRYRVYWHSLLHGHSGPERRKHLWQTSYPLMIQSGIECGMWSLGAVVSGWFGKVQLASYQVMNTIAQLGYMTYMGFGIATSIRVANYTGVGDIPGVRRIANAGLHMVLALATLASLVFIFFTEPLVYLFTPESDVAMQALLLIFPLVLYQYCDGVQLTYVNALRGTSEVKPLLWISIVSYIVVGVPLMLYMAVTLKMESVGVYYSFSGALFTASVLLIWAFKRALRRMERENDDKMRVVNTL